MESARELGPAGEFGYEGEAWLKQPWETDGAYRAFCDYRDQGPDRLLAAVYRKDGQFDRKKGASGRLTAWSVRNRWVERAGRYDQHMDGERLAAAREETRRLGVEMAEAYRETARRVRGIAKELLDRAEEFAKFPTKTTVVKSRDAKTGVVTAATFEPIPAATLRTAAVVVREVFDMVRALKTETFGESEPAAAVPTEAGGVSAVVRLHSEARHEAAEELDVWRREQVGKLASFQSAPPTPPTSSTPTG